MNSLILGANLWQVGKIKGTVLTTRLSRMTKDENKQNLSVEFVSIKKITNTQHQGRLQLKAKSFSEL